MKKRAYDCIFAIIIFFSMYCFFAIMHPLYIYDVDDWTYAGYWREAVPIWGDGTHLKYFQSL